MITYFLIFLSVLIGVVGQLLLKQGVTTISSALEKGLFSFFFRAALSPWIIAGLIGYGLGTAIWLLILSKVDVSFAYPMLATGYILLLIFSRFFLGEEISLVRLSGVVLITAGVVLITRS